MKTNHTNNTPKGMPPAQPDPGSYSWKLLLIKDARVHYVVLKQQPRTTHPTHQPHAKGRRSTARRASQPGNQKHTRPTPRTHPQRGTDTRHGPVVSGPNSVPNTTHRTPHRSVPGTPTPQR